MTMALSEALASLRDKRIFFGHQSVGGNIMDGLAALNTEQQLGLTLCEAVPADNPTRGIFLHSKVGRNFEPDAKDTHFASIIDAATHAPVDIAFYKYCYVDVDANTDVDMAVDRYLTNLEDLQQRHPHTRFIACTVPLTIVQRGTRAMIKKLLRRPIGGYADNRQRNRFNALLRQHCQRRLPIFDLAQIESSKADMNGQCTYRYMRERYEALCENYASDGRHLNSAGGKYVALEMLKCLGRLEE